MVKIKYISIATAIFAFLSTTGCRNSVHTDSLRAVTEWNGRQIEFPTVIK